MTDGFIDQRKGMPPRDFNDKNNVTAYDAMAAVDAGFDLPAHRKGKPLP